MARVQGNTNQDWTGGSVPSIAVTLSAIGSGHLLAGGGSCGNDVTADLQVLDGASNACTLTTIYDAGSNQTVFLLRRENVTNAPTTFTLSRPSAQNLVYASLTVDEFDGLETSGALTGTPALNVQNSPGTGEVLSSGNTTPAVNGCLIYGFTQNDGGSTLATVGSGYTSATSNATAASRSEYKVQTTAAAVAATFSISANESHVTGVMAFKPAAAGGTAVGQASENDSAQAITRRKTRALAQASESNSAQAITRRKMRAVAQALEADTAQPVAVGGDQIVALGQASESDAAQAITRAKRKSLGQAAQTDAAQPITRAAVVQRLVRWGAAGDGTGYAVGWDIVSHAGSTADAYAHKADAGSNLSYVITGLSLGLTYYVGVSSYITYGDTGTWSLVDEYSFLATVALQIAQAAESDTSQAITRRKTRALAQASESDAAPAIVHAKRKGIGQALESESAQTLTSRKTISVAQALETDAAQTISLPGTQVVPVGQALEADAAQAIVHAKRKGLGQAVQSDAAQIITHPIARQLGLVLEIDLSGAITWAPKRRQVAAALESDVALAVTAAAPVPDIVLGRRSAAGRRRNLQTSRRPRAA